MKGSEPMKKRILTGVLILLLLLIAGICWFSLNKMSKRNQLREEVVSENAERIEHATQEQMPKIVISNVRANPGDKVTVTASIVNNPGILGMSMVLSYDENVMKLTNVENGDAFKDILEMTNTKNFKNGCSFLWDGENIESDQVSDGEILILEFQISKDAAAGKTPILLLLDEDGTVDRDLQTVDVSVDNGFLTVIK